MVRHRRAKLVFSESPGAGVIHERDYDIGLDLAKHVFQVHDVDARGTTVLRKRLRRRQVPTFFSPTSALRGKPGSVCDGAVLGARARALGHEVRLMPAQYGSVRQAQAVRRPTMRCVPIKTAEQQAAQLLHRCREQLVRQRTMLVNALRAYVTEFGIVAAQGLRNVAQLIAIVRDDGDVRLPEVARGRCCRCWQLSSSRSKRRLASVRLPPDALPSAGRPGRPSIHYLERGSPMRNRKREICTSGAAKDEEEQPPHLLARRGFLHLAAGAAALPAVSRMAWAQAYPSRPVRIIVTFAVGSASDVNSRLIGQGLSERLGQPFIVENRPGGGGSLGAAEAIRSRPDGYTMFFMSTSHTINGSFYNNLPFNIVDDTTPIAFLFSTNDVMVVNPSLPVKSVPEFIAYAKANPGRINMASQGVGSIGHLAGELFKFMTGINMVHIPYRSVALALADVISGQTHVQFATSTDSVPQIRGGQVRALAVSSKTRSPALPNVPTMAEYLPDYAYESWGGFAGPKNIPAEIVEVLNNEVNAVLVQPHIKAQYDDLGLRANATSPAEFGKMIAEETLKWAKVIKFAGITPE
jgi:tripartite-type tricarboxylate transporter receptor subunit TctC